ncbi:hypothetical protein [uncultured Allobaculum sp.]|uniref:hypothetical protein n=1 Tax=uncultured Allobaculum sp. TaxID=1187017 RepID=UPI00258561E0|nr:hypothetical protein [uncultured Allobaculum sp.]
MNTADIQVWKDIFSQLQTNIQDNDQMIREIKEQIALQEERNKQEIQKMVQTATSQKEELESLLAQVSQDGLFSLPADEEARNAFESSLKERIEQCTQVIDFAQSLLGMPATSEETLDKIRLGSRKDKEIQDVVASGFSERSLLGNWIHYFQKDLYTCQSFWDDHEFKEYDFRGKELMEERSGSYAVENGKVLLTYPDGKKMVYVVTGYSDDCLDYLISGTPIRFDYMPEDILNTLLEENANA